MNEIDEQNLLKSAINGDSEAFAVLLEKYYMMIYRVAYKWCGVKEDAEDIAQNVCIKLASSLKEFRGDSAFSTWLYRITLNATRDYQRKTKRMPKGSDIALENISTDSDNPEKQLSAQEIWEVVSTLPEKQRDAMLLVYGEELSHQEVAGIMDCAESTVSWYVHEAKKALKKILGPVDI